MPIVILSVAPAGLGGDLVKIESDCTGREFGSFLIVGLPDTSVYEARERVRAAIKNSGFDFPRLKTVVNLAPANLKKHGSCYDVPIAVSIISNKNKFVKILDRTIFIGELSLSGDLRPVRGVLPGLIRASELGAVEAYVPSQNAPEAAASGIKIFPINNLRELIAVLMGKLNIAPHGKQKFLPGATENFFDMEAVSGQRQAKRGLEIAAAGGHNLLMVGPPGSGKTLLAKSFASILPELEESESLEISKIYSVSGLLDDFSGLVRNRPFRAPHHSSSTSSLVGGGSWPRPGEVSLAHRGVLFLDELPEFSRTSLESLRQPLEDGHVKIGRALGTFSFPARFILVAAANPCPCGLFGSSKLQCRCRPNDLINYRARISGPILDRIDMHVKIERERLDIFSKSEKLEENSKQIRLRVSAAREIQRKRLRGSGLFNNSELNNQRLLNIIKISKEAKTILRSASDTMNFSARSYFKIIKMAQTIADLDGDSFVLEKHILEALQYRPFFAG